MGKPVSNFLREDLVEFEGEFKPNPSKSFGNPVELTEEKLLNIGMDRPVSNFLREDLVDWEVEVLFEPEGGYLLDWEVEVLLEWEEEDNDGVTWWGWAGLEGESSTLEVW